MFFLIFVISSHNQVDHPYGLSFSIVLCLVVNVKLNIIVETRKNWFSKKTEPLLAVLKKRLKNTDLYRTRIHKLKTIITSFNEIPLNYQAALRDTELGLHSWSTPRLLDISLLNRTVWNSDLSPILFSNIFTFGNFMRCSTRMAVNQIREGFVVALEQLFLIVQVALEISSSCQESPQSAYNDHHNLHNKVNSKSCDVKVNVCKKDLFRQRPLTLE